MRLSYICIIASCRSREGAWIEIVAVDKSKAGDCVAPVRERGLKFVEHLAVIFVITRRSREGAWIEIKPGIGADYFGRVAPVRERGLKLS